MEIQKYREYKKKIVESCGRVIEGKEEVTELLLICFLCGGHILLEDIPGTGKTMLLRAFAESIGGKFQRIQFTPDLLPSDLTGLRFYNQKTGEFEFRQGPLFANLILADEINRATPRTQSSLLEVMEERQITVDGMTMELEEPFLVMATQNPLESYGTFPLPEAQIDRFFMRLSIGYMEREQEMRVLQRRKSSRELIRELVPCVTPEETERIRKGIREVRVSDEVLGYLMDLVEATRKSGGAVRGVSTRGAIALYQAAQTAAALQERDYVIPEDIRKMAPHVLIHRMARQSQGGSASAAGYLKQLIEQLPVPLEEV